MILFKKVTDLRNFLALSEKKGKKIGFVPTMGALHEGHSSLIRASMDHGMLTVCSIFVNPTQFNDRRDFEKYPHTIEKDIDLLESLGCPVLFLPDVEEVYPDGLNLTHHYELGYLETILEGKFRPGHFQGVCAVMDRLLKIVGPSQLFMGQKDFQQCMVIKKLISLMGKKDQIELVICPTLRAPDGLAMSSRNTRLNEQSRKTAPAIYKALLEIKKNIDHADLETLKSTATNQLENAGFKVDYVEIAGADTLEILQQRDGHQRIVALAAAYLQEVRLIDNLILAG